MINCYFINKLKNDLLTSLNLCCKQIENIDEFKVLEKNDTLTSLNLSENEIENIDVFRVLENNSSLTSLNLSINKINKYTFEKIFADILQKNTTLIELLYYYEDSKDSEDSEDY